MKIKKHNLIFISLMIVSLAFLIGGCFNNTNNEEDIHKINKRSIEEVLRKSLTCPSLTSLENFNPTTEGISIIGKNADKTSEKSDKNPIGEELKSMYEPYLTENYYKKFIGTHAMTFEIIARRSGYEIRVVSVNIIPKENDSIGYNFKVNVTYWKDIEDKSTTDVLGTAQCLEEGKISYLKYTDIGGLFDDIPYNVE